MRLTKTQSDRHPDGPLDDPRQGDPVLLAPAQRALERAALRACRSDQPRERDTQPCPTSPRDRQGDSSTSALESPHLVPALDERLGPYRVRFARDVSDLEAVRRLRYAVFNVELGEGLAGAHETGLDADAFDRQCQHLMVIEEDSGAVVGTYRMQTVASARPATAGTPPASSTSSGLPPPRSSRSPPSSGAPASLERHRDRTVLFLLWHGLLAYAITPA